MPPTSKWVKIEPPPLNTVIKTVRINQNDPSYNPITPEIGAIIYTINEPDTFTDYTLTFYMPTAYVSKIDPTNNGLEVTVTNPVSEADFDKVITVVDVSTLNIDDPSGAVVRDMESGNIIDSVLSFLSGGKFEFISFDASVPSNSKRKFNIEVSDVTRINTERAPVQYIAAQPINIQELPAICQADFVCSGYSTCNFENTQNVFSDTLDFGIQTAICVFTDNSCPPPTKIQQSCLIDNQIFTETISSENVDGVFFSPQDKVVKVTNADGLDIGTFGRSEDGKITIVFAERVGAPLSPGEEMPSSCWNLQLDGEEEGIDCGGLCFPCILDPVDYSFIWPIIIILLIPFLFINSVNLRTWKIFRLSKLGNKALRERDLQNSIIFYDLLRDIYLSSDDKTKVITEKEGLLLYARIKNTLEDNKFIISESKYMPGKLPPLLYERLGKNRGTGLEVLHDVLRIKRLIALGNEALDEKKVVVAKANYDIIQSMYENLSDKDKKRVKKSCDKYYSYFTSWLKMKKIKYIAGPGDIPKIDIISKITGGSKRL